MLNQGISFAFDLFYRNSLLLESTWEQQSKSKEGRSLSFLKRLITDPYTIDVIDTDLYILDKPFELLKNKSQQSIIDYFQTMMNQMYILFAAYLTFLVSFLVGFFLIMFQRLRDSMFSTNLILRIIPSKQILEKDDQEKLQNFFIQ